MALVSRLCKHCQTPFQSKTARALYCSHRCNKEYHRSPERKLVTLPKQNQSQDKEHNMTVLKKLTQADIDAVRSAAEAAYMIRLEGHETDIKAGADAQGNYPRRFFRGAVVTFDATGVDPFIHMLLEKLGAGYKMSPVPSDMLMGTFTVSLIKPDAELAHDIALEQDEAESELRAEVEKANDAIIAATVAQRKATELRKRAEAAKAADDALEAELLAEVRKALGAK